MSITSLASRLAAISLAAVALTAAAHEFRVGSLTVQHPYARVTQAGQGVGGAYFELRNQGDADRLVSASAAVAERVELHTMAMEGDVMRMRQLDALDLPAGQTVKLAPGGQHLMLIGLKAPLTLGMRFPLELRFEKAGPVTVMVWVEPATLPPGAHAR
jgi:periplasmic copper chaperone A